MKKKLIAVVMAMVLMMSLSAVSTFAATTSNCNTSTNLGITIAKNRDIVYNNSLPIHSAIGFSGAWAWKAPDGTFVTIGVGVPGGRFSNMGSLINELANDNKTSEEQLV